MSDAPDQIWIDRNGGNWSPCSGGTQDVEYRRADLPPTLSAAMELPEVRDLIKTADWIQDQMCEGFCRDLPSKGYYHKDMDFDCAVCRLRAALAAINEPKP